MSAFCVTFVSSSLRRMHAYDTFLGVDITCVEALREPSKNEFCGYDKIFGYLKAGRISCFTCELRGKAGLVSIIFGYDVFMNQG